MIIDADDDASTVTSLTSLCLKDTADRKRVVVNRMCINQHCR